MSRLAAEGDEAIRQQEGPGTLDTIMDNLKEYPHENDDEADLVCFLSEAVMSPAMRTRFAKGYQADLVYAKIIEALRTPDSAGRKPATREHNGDIVSASKPGHTFRLRDQLLYNTDSEGTERLVVPGPLIMDFLRDAHDDKHHFGRDRMMRSLEGVHWRRKRNAVLTYLRHCHQCGAQKKDNQLPIGSL